MPKLPVNLDKGYTKLWKGGKPVYRRRLKSLVNRVRRRGDSVVVIESKSDAVYSQEEAQFEIDSALLELKESNIKRHNDISWLW